MTELKAYTVHDGGDHSVIVFALHNVVARREGANELDCGFNEVDYCTRSPEFDAYTPGPVPPLVAIEHGWWFECCCCGRKVDGDLAQSAEDDGEDPEFYVAVADGRTVYCSETCRQMEFVERRARKAAEAALIEVFEAAFGGAAITHVWANLDGGRLSKSSRMSSASSVTFKFPGGKAPAHWKFGDEKCSLNRDDIDAFCAWRGKPVPPEFAKEAA